MTENNFTEGYAGVAGIDLYYKIFGSGEPIIILHGGPGFDHIHMLPFKELAKSYKIIFYDQRGTGKSSGEITPESINVDNFVEDLNCLRKKLKLGKTNILGHSWGAVLALYYAIKYPKTLINLILLSAYSNADIFGQYFKNIQNNTLADDAQKMKEIERNEDFKHNEPAALQEYLEISLKPFFHRQDLISGLDLTLTPSTAKNLVTVADLMFKDLGNFDLSDKLTSIKCPVLLIHGNFDPIPLIGPERINQSLPKSRLVILPDSGHFSFIESPNETLKEIWNFLKK